MAEGRGPVIHTVVPREGTPISKDPSRRGNLRIKFYIKFPSRLTAEGWNQEAVATSLRKTQAPNIILARTRGKLQFPGNVSAQAYRWWEKPFHAFSDEIQYFQ
ncbi:hypothetical protein MRB53_016526 [Persea americana]|uniref:Uncharacterized protein n=1 Tax=Persea americana TaxID=3435 RepID=A0ACC2M2C3_PERAE|nr:hypothetical protein MRB53_016526 [Persea americana]